MVQPELLGVAAALMLLGAAVSLCIKCSATKREMQLSEHRNQLESQRRFEVIRTQYSATQRLEKTKRPENLSVARKTTERLSDSHHIGYGSRDDSRYQNFLTEDYLQENSTYVEPISLDYNNGARFFTRPKEKEEDSYSYENVIIGVSFGSDLVTDEAADYENSAAIHTWKLQQEEESPDEEPDYINTAPAAVSVLLSQQRDHPLGSMTEALAWAWTFGRYLFYNNTKNQQQQRGSDPQPPASETAPVPRQGCRNISPETEPLSPEP